MDNNQDVSQISRSKRDGGRGALPQGDEEKVVNTEVDCGVLNYYLVYGIGMDPLYAHAQ